MPKVDFSHVLCRNEISDDGLSLFSEKVLNMQAQLKKLKLILVGLSFLFF